jgi:ADP-sugar diphosphatase
VLKPYHKPVVAAVAVASADTPAVQLTEAEKRLKDTADNIKKFGEKIRYPVKNVTDGSDLPYTGAGNSVVINGYYVPLVFEVLAHAGYYDKLMQMQAFTNWCKNMDTKLSVTEIRVQSVDMFGPRVGFVKFFADIYDTVCSPVSGIIFMRGGAVAMLPIFIVEGKKYTVLTKQARGPVGAADFIEIPAGMIDDSDNFGGVAAKELKEELDLDIPLSQLFDLTNFIKKTPTGFYPSVGGCDEFIRFYLFEKTVTKDAFEAMQRRMLANITGNASEGEKITVQFVEYDRLLYATQDMKTISAIALYDEFNKQRNVYVGNNSSNSKVITDGLKLEFERDHNDGSAFEALRTVFIASAYANGVVMDAGAVSRGLTEKFKKLHETEKLSAVGFLP